MANLNYVHCNDTAVIRNLQIPFSIVGTTSAGGGEQPQNIVNGGHHHSCDYFAGHPIFPGVHEASIINMDMTRKKTMLTIEQVDALEMSFQEEIELEKQQPPGRITELRKNKTKLDPEKKLKLSKELGIHPRQVTVWFQNRRAKLKGKQLERLYNELQQDYEIVSRENQYLQQEVMELKDKLDGRQSMQASIEFMEHGSLVQAESNNITAHQSTWTSVAVQCSNYVEKRQTSNSNTKISGNNSYLFSDEVMSGTRAWLTLAPARSSPKRPNLQ